VPGRGGGGGGDSGNPAEAASTPLTRSHHLPNFNFKPSSTACNSAAHRIRTGGQYILNFVHYYRAPLSHTHTQGT